MYVFDARFVVLCPFSGIDCSLIETLFSDRGVDPIYARDAQQQQKEETQTPSPLSMCKKALGPP